MVVNKLKIGLILQLGYIRMVRLLEHIENRVRKRKWLPLIFATGITDDQFGRKNKFSDAWFVTFEDL